MRPRVERPERFPRLIPARAIPRSSALELGYSRRAITSNLVLRRARRGEETRARRRWSSALPSCPGVCSHFRSSRNAPAVVKPVNHAFLRRIGRTRQPMATATDGRNVDRRRYRRGENREGDAAREGPRNCWFLSNPDCRLAFLRIFQARDVRIVNREG